MTINEKTTATAWHCGYCGLAIGIHVPAIERCRERFCSEAHADVRPQEGSRAMRRRTFIAVATSGIGTLIIPGRILAGVARDAIGDLVERLPKGELPKFARTADTRRLYQYAVDHGDELQYIPCTCGCGRVGHKSNRDCYVKSFNKDGTLTFTSHAAT